MLGTHSVASGSFQSWEILEGESISLSPLLLPATKSPQQALDSPAGHFASLSLSLLICEMGSKSPYHALLPGRLSEWVMLSMATAHTPEMRD